MEGEKPPRPSDSSPYEGGEQDVVSSADSPPSQGGVPEGGGGYKNLAPIGLCGFLSITT